MIHGERRLYLAGIGTRGALAPQSGGNLLYKPEFGTDALMMASDAIAVNLSSPPDLHTAFRALIDMA